MSGIAEPALPPTIVIRVDSGYQIGFGHVRRCLYLAIFLKENGFRPVFICRKLAGDISHVIDRAGFDIIFLPENESLAFSVFNVDFSSASFDKMARDAKDSAISFAEEYPGVKIAWAVTDHLLIRAPWQTLFAKEMGCKILAIDGQADAAHYANILLDPQIHETSEAKWAGLLPGSCVVFSGPSCLPLAPAFEVARNSAVVRTGSLTRVLVCFGGTDTEDIVYRTVRILLTWVKQNVKVGVDVAVPMNLLSIERLKELLADHPWCQLHVGLDDLSSLMLAADIAIGGGGIMLWERCVLGLPAIVVPLAQNQEKPIARLENQGAVVSLKLQDDKYELELIKALCELVENPTALRIMSKNAFRIMSDWPETNGWLRIMKGNTHE
tara:strand:+ start:7479 stop:8624 length:1146 start_codon:yes stop_codon:yes gene_type:complete